MTHHRPRDAAEEDPLELLRAGLELEEAGKLGAAAAAFRLGASIAAEALRGERNATVRRDLRESVITPFLARADELDEALGPEKPPPERAEAECRAELALRAAKRRWARIVGLSSAREFVANQVLAVCQRPELYLKRRGRPRDWRTALLLGHPGSGKSELLQALAGLLEASCPGCQVAVVRCADLAVDVSGMAHLQIRQALETAIESQARGDGTATAVVILLDLDAIASTRAALLRAKSEADAVDGPPLVLREGRKLRGSLRIMRDACHELLHGLRDVKSVYGAPMILACASAPLESAVMRRFDMKIDCPLLSSAEQQAVLATSQFGPLLQREKDGGEELTKKFLARVKGLVSGDIFGLLEEAENGPMRDCIHAKFMVARDDGKWGIDQPDEHSKDRRRSTLIAVPCCDLVLPPLQLRHLEQALDYSSRPGPMASIGYI